MIGKNLQKLRKMMNLTQETLAEKVGVARQTIAMGDGGEHTGSGNVRKAGFCAGSVP